MKAVVLIENTKGEIKALKNEHGLSIYIEKDNKHILFDTGRSENFINNAEKLGIDLKAVDSVVLSHGHSDHGGGLLSFFKINQKAKIYMKSKAVEDYCSGNVFFMKNIGIDHKVFREYSNRIEFIDEFTEIIEDIFIITDIKKNHKEPDGNKYLYRRIGNEITKDEFEHELIMVIKGKGNIHVFTGCGHNGIINIIDSVKKIFVNENIKTIVGGFHLSKIPAADMFTSSQKDIDSIVEKIIEERVEKIYTGHCTGEKAYKRMKIHLKDKIEYMRTGMSINFEYN